MGYQESFIFTNASNIQKNNADIEGILKIFRKYGVRCADDDMAECVCKLHFNENVSGYKGWGGTEGRKTFKQGMEMLVVCGERSEQRSPTVLFHGWDNRLPLTEEEDALVGRVQIWFVENLEFVFEAEKDGRVSVERLSLTADNPKNH